MKHGILIGILGAGLALPGCVAKSWENEPKTLVTDAQVAAALGDRGDALEPFDPASVPQMDPPAHVRPCCSFGMDLKVKVGAVTVPGYTKGNIVGVDGLGRHEYDNGTVTLNERLTSLATIEGNGLVYTCRGGFVDVAHVRDNADMTLFLTTKIVAALPGPTVVTLEGDGATRRVAIKGVPPEAIERLGRWETAAALAEWASFQISIWHEIVTFYGYESFPGFSEKVSAFSPEDLYSNAVGAKLAAGIVTTRRIHTRDEWDDTLKAWIPVALEHLGAQPVDTSKLVMKALDGRWWDSKKELPDWTLVTKRKMDIGARVAPWLYADAKLPPDSVIEAACSNRGLVLPLTVPDHLGEVPIAEIATVDFEVKDWAPEALIPKGSASRRLTNADFPRIVKAISAEMEKTLGPGFDRPGSAPAKIEAPAETAAPDAPAK